MLIKQYAVTTRHYDYFGGDKRTTKTFDTLAEAFTEYRKQRKYTFSYDDGSVYEVYPVRSYFKYVPDPVARYHARSKYEWQRELNRRYDESHFGFHEDEVEYLISLVTPSFDIDDEDIII